MWRTFLSFVWLPVVFHRSSQVLYRFQRLSGELWVRMPTRNSHSQTHPINHFFSYFRDGPQETARKLGIFTDGEPNEPPSSTSNQVLIRFRSNNEKGGLFHIHYQGALKVPLWSISSQGRLAWCLTAFRISVRSSYSVQTAVLPATTHHPERRDTHGEQRVQNW